MAFQVGNARRRFWPDGCAFRSGSRRPIMASAMKTIILPIVIKADSDGFFVFCPALQGCYSQGDTYEEALANIKDAVKLHIEDRQADGEEIPQVSVSLSTVQIAV